MIAKLFDRVSDETLNKIGRRYNVFCLLTLPPYMIAVIGALFMGPTVGKMIGFLVPLAWVVIWLPNLLLIGVRAHRDFLASLERMKEWGKADREFFAAHVERMALLRGEDRPDDAPPTIN